MPTRKGVTIPLDVLAKAVRAVKERATRTAPGEVACIARGEALRVCFAIREYQGHVYGEVRKYYRGRAGGESWQSGKGVTLPLVTLSQLAAALQSAQAEIDAFSLEQLERSLRRMQDK